MAQLPVGVQYSQKWYIYGPDGAVATFNDKTDPNYVGVITDISGFDSPEVRESADDLVQMDGGIHGDFFFGRRPITLTGKVYDANAASDRNVRLENLKRATAAMRRVPGGTGPANSAGQGGNARLTWTPDGGEQVYMDVRRQQPLRITGGFDKDFQIQMVAADPHIYSWSLYSTVFAAVDTSTISGFDLSGLGLAYDIDFGTAVPLTGGAIIENQGSATSYPLLTVYGPGQNPTLYNATTNQSISLIYTLGASEYITIDTLNRTVLLNGSSPRYSAIDFINTDWWGLAPGFNDIRLLYYTSSPGAQLRVEWRDAWL